MAYTGLDVPVDWNDDNYVVVNSDITYPASMCAAEQYDCQYQGATWSFG